MYCSREYQASTRLIQQYEKSTSNFTTYCVVQATAFAVFKLWPSEEAELEGISLQLFIIISALHY